MANKSIDSSRFYLVSQVPVGTNYQNIVFGFECNPELEDSQLASVGSAFAQLWQFEVSHFKRTDTKILEVDEFDGD